MRSIFAGIIVLSALMAVVDVAQAQKHPKRLPGYGYRQALIGHRQPTQDDGNRERQGRSTARSAGKPARRY